MYCPNCGVNIKDGSNFCYKCGYKIEMSEPIVQESSKLPTKSDIVKNMTDRYDRKHGNTDNSISFQPEGIKEKSNSTSQNTKMGGCLKAWLTFNLVIGGLSLFLFLIFGIPFIQMHPELSRVISPIQIILSFLFGILILTALGQIYNKKKSGFIMLLIVFIVQIIFEYQMLFNITYGPGSIIIGLVIKFIQLIITYILMRQDWEIFS